MSMHNTIERLADPFRRERDSYFQVRPWGPRCSEISVALPHLLALAAILVLTVLGS